jgi:hypothetical protein
MQGGALVVKKPKPRKTCSYAGCDQTYPDEARRTTTLCRSHAARDVALRPGRREKLANHMREQNKIPGYTEAKARKVSAAHRKRLRENPDLMRAARENGRQLGKLHGDRTMVADPALRAKGNDAYRAKMLANIPRHYWDLYLDLARTTKLNAKERKAVIDCEVERDAREFAKTGILPVTGGK